MWKVPPSPLARRAGRAVAVMAAVSGVAAVAPVAAQAVTVQGAVIAVNAHRGTVVTAGAGGKISTLRVGAGQARVGRRLRATAVQLADGTFRVTRLRVAGRAGRVKVRATVVRRMVAGYLVSAGGSTFSLSLRRASHGHHAVAAAAADPSSLEPGDVIVATTNPADGSIQPASVQITGQSSVAELEGIVVSAAAGQLSVAVEHQGLVTVTVPDGMTVQAAPGDEVELMVSVGADGAFTLVSAAGDDQSDRHDDGFQVDGESGRVEVHGLITAVAADAVAVQAGQSPPITCAVPAGVDVSGFAVGDQVELQCVAAGTGLTLREMQSDHAHVESQSQTGAGGDDASGDDQSGDGPHGGGHGGGDSSSDD